MISRLLFKQLLMPPQSLLLLLLIAWLLRKLWPRLAATLFAVSLGCLYLLCLPFTTQQLAAIVENQPALDAARWPQLAREADAIVVLGGGSDPADPGWGSDQPSLFTAQRLRYAARLHRASGLPLLVTGGPNYGRPLSEARIMADTLQQDFGTGTRWLEEKSRTTRENAQYSAAILLPRARQRIVLVTDAWHMRRARWSFEQAGFTVLPAPQGFYSVMHDMTLPGKWLPGMNALQKNTLLLNELTALWIYPLIYKN